LASGFEAAEVKEGGKVTITMWPIVTYADFTLDPKGSDPVKFESGVKPELAPGVDWKLDWKITKKAGTENGLEPLIAAQNALSGISESTLRVAGKKNVVDGVDAPIEGTTTDFSFSLNPGPANEVYHIDRPHWVNFNLEYVPFNLTSFKVWSSVSTYIKTSFFDFSDGAPVWVIRNGLNDQAQDENTTFAPNGLGKGKNGNGAVLASVKAFGGWDGDNNGDGVPDHGEPDADGVSELPDWAGDTDLLLFAGAYHGPEDDKAFITFQTQGYTGSVKIFYAVVEKGTYKGTFVPYGEFTNSLTNLDNTGVFAAGGPHGSLVSIPDAAYPYTNGDERIWEVWLVFSSGGNVSNRIAIEISENNITQSGIVIAPEWGDEKTPSP
jgi:hypothetical protein